MRPVYDGEFQVTCPACGEGMVWQGKGKKAIQVCGCERAPEYVPENRRPGRRKCSAKGAKAKGNGEERAVVKAFEAIGWSAYRTAGSGAHGSRNNEQAFATDVRVKRGDTVLRIESKRHASIGGVKTLNKLRDNSEILWLRQDFEEAFVFMPASVFLQIAGEK